MGTLKDILIFFIFIDYISIGAILFVNKQIFIFLLCVLVSFLDIYLDMGAFHPDYHFILISGAASLEN